MENESGSSDLRFDDVIVWKWPTKPEVVGDDEAEEDEVVVARLSGEVDIEVGLDEGVGVDDGKVFVVSGSGDAVVIR